MSNKTSDDSMGAAKQSTARAATSTKHAPWEDAQGIFSAIMLISLAVAMIQELGLVTGGITGLSLVLSYATSWPLGVLLFVLNLPFYILAIFRLGWAFTIKTVISVTLLSVIVEIQPDWFSFAELNLLYGTCISGLLVGFSFVALFRHRASLGGFGVLALWLEDLFGIRAGLTQLGLDIGVFAFAYFVIPLDILIYSFIGTVILNVVLAINHRKDRYIVH